MLHEFDSYLEERYLSRKARYQRQGWNTSVRRGTPIALREKRSLKPAMTYVRYADDFVALIKGTRAQAEAIREEFRQFLSEKLKLTLNMDKTHVTHVNEGFVFLGHRIVRKRSGKGHMRPVTGIPRQSARRFAAQIIKLLSGNYDINKVTMIERINRMIAGWTSFYRHTMYTGKVFQKLDTIIFWKLGHWLARKYRTRVNKLMRKWYGYSTSSHVKTWVVYQKVGGQTRFAALNKCAHSVKFQRGLSLQQVNPYRLIGKPANTYHRSHFDIATMTST